MVKKTDYLLDSLQTTEVILFITGEEGAVRGCGDETDEDNDVQTGFHCEMSI